MSAHRRSIRLSSRADRDFRGILLYTLQTWGPTQRRTYRAILTNGLHQIAQHPYVGQPRDDIFPGCRTLQIEQHVLYYYQPEADTIEVLRILHSRQNPEGKVDVPFS
jgi:toxin ParE1/3/4